MKDQKPWYASRGVWGSLFAAVASVVVFVNSAFPGSVPDDVVDQVNDPNLPVAFAGVAGFIASVLALFGRVKAKSEIAPSVTGKRVPALLLCGVLSVGVVATQPGCALFSSTATETDRLRSYDQLNEVYIAALDVAIQARSLGKIDAETWRDDVLPLIVRGDRLLDDYEAAARLNDATAMQRIGTLFDGVVRELTIATSTGDE